MFDRTYKEQREQFEAFLRRMREERERWAPLRQITRVVPCQDESGNWLPPPPENKQAR